MRVYVASSWRNELQPHVVTILKEAGHEVYDFRCPAPDDAGFHWSEIDSDWKQWSPERFSQALDHPLAESGYLKDKTALDGCDACVLVLPCGRSAHLEAGFALGQGKPTTVLLHSGEPELMYKLGHVSLTITDVINFLKGATK